MRSPRTCRFGLLLILCYFIAAVPLSWAQQMSASASTLVRAVVQGSVTVSARSVPVSLVLDPSDPAQNHTAFPLSITWNLNTAESQGFHVIGYFANPGAALSDESGTVQVPSSQVLGRMGAGEYRPFGETNEFGPSGGSLKLFEKAVVPGDARGSQSGLLEIRVSDDTLQHAPSGVYQGMLYIEVRHY